MAWIGPQRRTTDAAIGELLDAVGWPTNERTPMATITSTSTESTAAQLREQAAELEQKERAQKAERAKRARQSKAYHAKADAKRQAEAEEAARKIARQVNAFMAELRTALASESAMLGEVYLEGLMARATASVGTAPSYQSR